MNREPTRRFPLLSIRQPYKYSLSPILPILPSSPPDTLSLFETPTALPHIPQPTTSTQAPGIITSESDYVDQLHSPGGPWCLRHSLLVPDEDAGVHFTYDSQQDSEIVVEHDLKIVIAVLKTPYPGQETSDGLQNVTVCFPVHIFSVSCLLSFSQVLRSRNAILKLLNQAPLCARVE